MRPRGAGISMGAAEYASVARRSFLLWVDKEAAAIKAGDGKRAAQCRARADKWKATYEEYLDKSTPAWRKQS